MSDNELRDRIAKIIDKTDMEAGDEDDHNIALAESVDVAQAIIDDLGLTVEDRNDGSESRTAPDGSIIYGVKCRVVGRWEKQ